MVETRDAGRGAFHSGRASAHHRRLVVILFTIAAVLAICGSYISRFAGVTVDTIVDLDVAKKYPRHDWSFAVKSDMASRDLAVVRRGAPAGAKNLVLEVYDTVLKRRIDELKAS